MRAEDKIKLLKISGLAFGPGIGHRISFVNDRATSGYENTGEGEAPKIEELLKNGFPTR